MKVLLINGSPHEKGNTYIGLKEMEQVFAREGIETELVQVGGTEIRPCNACGACGKLGKCVKLSFTDAITASSDSNGIHYFAKRVYIYLCDGGYDVIDSVVYANADTWNMYSQYYGCNSYAIRNNTYI